MGPDRQRTTVHEDQEGQLGASRHASTLDALAAGESGRIVRIDAEHRARLLAHGVVPGSSLVVERAGRFGGPCIVGVGSARVAIAAAVGRTIQVELDPAARPPTLTPRPAVRS